MHEISGIHINILTKNHLPMVFISSLSNKQNMLALVFESQKDKTKTNKQTKKTPLKTNEMKHKKINSLKN